MYWFLNVCLNLKTLLTQSHSTYIDNLSHHLHSNYVFFLRSKISFKILSDIFQIKFMPVINEKHLPDWFFYDMIWTIWRLGKNILSTTIFGRTRKKINGNSMEKNSDQFKFHIFNQKIWIYPKVCCIWMSQMNAIVVHLCVYYTQHSTIYYIQSHDTQIKWSFFYSSNFQ